jgi:hypothetical protein
VASPEKLGQALESGEGERAERERARAGDKGGKEGGRERQLE